MVWPARVPAPGLAAAIQNVVTVKLRLLTDRVAALNIRLAELNSELRDQAGKDQGIQDKINNTKDQINEIDREATDLINAEKKGDKDKVREIAKPNIDSAASALRQEKSEAEKNKDALKAQALQGQIDTLENATRDAGWRP